MPECGLFFVWYSHIAGSVRSASVMNRRTERSGGEPEAAYSLMNRPVIASMYTR